MNKYKFNLKFQETLAAVILRDSTIISSINQVVNPEYFTDPMLRVIVTGAISFHKKYRSTPSLTEFLNYVTDFNEAEQTRVKKLYRRKIKNKQFILDEAIGFAQHSSMKEAILMSTEMIDNYDNRLQISELIREALKVGFDSKKLGQDLTGGYQDRHIERLKYGLDRDTISTGIRQLDRCFEGGPSKKELYMVMAPPKGFKTGTLVNFGAAAITQRQKVIAYTMEVSEEKMVARYERRLSGISSPELITKQSEIDKALRKIKSIKGGLFVKEYPMRTPTVETFRNHTEMLISEGFIPDMIIIDYWDLIKGSTHSGEVRHQLTQIGAEMRAMMQQFNVVGWTASQVNRKAVTKKIIRMEDIAEDFGKIAIVDGAVAVCQTPKERKVVPARARLFVVVNREGEGGGMAYCTIDYDKMRIRELDGNFEEEDDE